MVAEINIISKAALEGKLEIRGNINNLTGEWSEIIQRINQSVDTLVGHIDSIPTPAMIIDTEFAIRYINKAGANVLGKSQEQLIGKKCFDLFKTSD